jgi:TolA-binding protein
MNPEECSGALLLRSRKQALSSDDELFLEAHLVGCESCRVLGQVLGDFDDVASARRHDAMRIERLASFARHTMVERRRSGDPTLAGGARRSSLPRASGLRGLLLAAAVFLMVAGASAAIVVQRAVRAQERITQQGVAASELGLPVGEHAKRVAWRVRSAAHGDVTPVEALLERPDELLGLGHARAGRAVPSGGCPGATCFDAATLFREANEERRNGRTRAAIAAYRELQRRAPASREAQFSALSLGNLLLATGEGPAALSQFDAALSSPATRNVQAEALYGRGRALGRLGRATEERANWQRVLVRFDA